MGQCGNLSKKTGSFSSEMNIGPSGQGERTLAYIPIIHTAADMGTLGASIRGKKLSTLGRQGLRQNVANVEKTWEKIEAVAARLPLTKGSVRLYQDGLPVCGHEREIVLEMAGAGSRNHRLLLELEARGATLMGTESPELLLQEYQLATATFAPGTTVRTNTNQQCLRDTLLEKRDRFVADRINTTLGAGESGILFIGMLHAVTQYLDSDIRVLYPLGHPTVKARRTG